MNAAPILTDPKAQRLHRDRARRQGPVTLLHELAAAEIEERLAEVNRRFTDIAVVTGHTDFWAARMPGARIVADTPVLDLAEGAQDLVIHALALHWADDPVGQLIQCRRALRPDGLLLAVLPGGRSLQELRAVLAETESRLTGGLSPRVLPMAEIRDLGALLQRAGFALPVADADLRDLHYRDLFHLVGDLRGSAETNALAARSRRPLPRRFWTEAAATYAAHFAAPDARIRATLELVYLTGWAPGPGQQQPLRPGSARQRLADALKVREQPLRGPDAGSGL